MRDIRKLIESEVDPKNILTEARVGSWDIDKENRRSVWYGKAIFEGQEINIMDCYIEIEPYVFGASPPMWVFSLGTNDKRLSPTVVKKVKQLVKKVGSNDLADFLVKEDPDYKREARGHMDGRQDFVSGVQTKKNAFAIWEEVRKLSKLMRNRK